MSASSSSSNYLSEKEIIDSALRYYTRYNKKIFNRKLPKVTTSDPSKLKSPWRYLKISINRRLRTTSGRAFLKNSWYDNKKYRTAEIELNPRLVHRVSYLKNTLVHEMCHVAMWIIDETIKPAHGKLFKKYADQAMTAVPILAITASHTREPLSRYTYECTKCDQSWGRQRKIDLSVSRCGKCRSKLRLLTD